uniref:Uncharacterized protein n=1 Tax=Canis lupus dingo TaxID=286419 RepID=A0A8C0KY55_CANLU
WSFLIRLCHVFGELQDLINSIITAMFLLIVAILAMQEMERRHLFYVGGIQCLMAAMVCILDAMLATKTMREKIKRFLGIELDTNVCGAGGTGPTRPQVRPQPGEGAAG